jgi:hypothetical protein
VVEGEASSPDGTGRCGARRGGRRGGDGRVGRAGARARAVRVAVPGAGTAAGEPDAAGRRHSSRGGRQGTCSSYCSRERRVGSWAAIMFFTAGLPLWKIAVPDSGGIECAGRAWLTPHPSAGQVGGMAGVLKNKRASQLARGSGSIKSGLLLQSPGGAGAAAKQWARRFFAITGGEEPRIDYYDNQQQHRARQAPKGTLSLVRRGRAALRVGCRGWSRMTRARCPSAGEGEGGAGGGGGRGAAEGVHRALRGPGAPPKGHHGGCGRNRTSAKKSTPKITFNRRTLHRKNEKIPMSTTPKLASPNTYPEPCTGGGGGGHSNTVSLPTSFASRPRWMGANVVFPCRRSARPGRTPRSGSR